MEKEGLINNPLSFFKRINIVNFFNNIKFLLQKNTPKEDILRGINTLNEEHINQTFEIKGKERNIYGR